jgi:MFS family permease
VAVLAVCFVMNMLARGASETFAVYLLALEREFQSTRSELTGVYSVFMLVNGLASPLVGMAFDRFGPRASYGVGLLALALAYALASRAHALWQLYLSLGVLVGIGVASLSMVTASGLISRWFRARLGTAMGLAYAGYGLGVIAIVPLSQVLIAEHGWRHSYWLLSCAIFLVVPVFALLPWRRWAAGRSDLSEAVHATRRRAPWTVRAAARDSAFWGLFAVFFFTSTAIYSATVQAVVYLVDVGFTPLLAATAFGFIGFLSTLGMGSAGWLCDRFGPRLTVSLSFSFTVAGLFMLMCLSFVPTAWLLAASVFAFGLSAGSRGPVISTLAAALFSGGGLGAVYGAISMGLGLGAAVGSWTAGLLYDLSGSYLAVFALSITASLLALSQFWLVPALRTGRRPTAGTRPR